MHPYRTALHNELHARPSLYFNEPAHVFHIALLDQGGVSAAVIAALTQDAAASDASAAQGLVQLDGHPLKWERHAEFFTLTLVQPKQTGGEFWPTLPATLEALIEPHRALIINAVQILVEAEQHWEGHNARYGFKDPAGSQIGGGDAVVWSDFRLCADGRNRILLVNRTLNAYRLGRMIRRLLEIETYRMMASLTLPVAQAVDRQLKDYDQQLASLSDRNADPAATNAKQLLGAIAQLSATIVRSTAIHRQRFSAAEAYAQLVFERIGELRESHVGDCQRLGIFIERRFKPTVRYCAVTDQRLARLGQSVANLGELLQTRVQVEVEEQNSAILRSLNSRASTQIKIQRAVEGLSIIAISYYLLSLFKLGVEGAHSLGLDLSPQLAASLLGPLALLLIGGIALRIRKAKRHGASDPG
ncbi:DUF3422 domain-containing protein [Pseudomonas sp.]|uniref:DUF3422 domain-containing protein n=1 Tax=Pseudomonas sp. TaxID=306 RepID=UPI003BB6CDEB